MYILEGAKVGSMWMLRNGALAMYEPRGISDRYMDRPHCLMITVVPAGVSSICVGDRIHRYSNGSTVSEGPEGWFPFDVVGPAASRYPTNGVRHGTA